jgi:hypothetical protein
VNRGARERPAEERAARAYELRRRTTSWQASIPLPADPVNGDEQRYATRFASFTKGLPHDDTGEVDVAAYGALVMAILSNDATAIARVPLGGTLQFVNPRAAHAYAMCGIDPHRVGLPAPPAFASAEAAADMVELYWQARLRDVPFQQLSQHPAAAEASADLTRLTAYRGPKSGGVSCRPTSFEDRPVEIGRARKSRSFSTPECRRVSTCWSRSFVSLWPGSTT